MAKPVPPNAQRQSPAALTEAQAVESFLARDWSENTRRNFASDLKRFREAVGRRRVGRLKPEELAAYLFRFLCHDSPPPQMVAIPGNGNRVVSFTLRADCPRRGRAR